MDILDSLTHLSEVICWHDLHLVHDHQSPVVLLNKINQNFSKLLPLLTVSKIRVCANKHYRSLMRIFPANLCILDKVKLLFPLNSFDLSR